SLAARAISAWRWLRRPDYLAKVRLADDLELGGGAVTAYRLLQEGGCGAEDCRGAGRKEASSTPWRRGGVPGDWQGAALAHSLAACAGFQAGAATRYPLIPSWTPWRGIAILLVVFTGLALTPSPLRPYWETRREERAALAAAAAAAERLVEPLAGLHRDGRPLLPEELQRRLDDLDRAIKETRQREEAAALLQQAGRDLDQVAAELAPAGQEAARLAALWQEQAGAAWQQLAAALARGDAAATERAAAELWLELTSLPQESPQAREAALRFWQAAEATGRPELRQALREAARTLSNPGSQEGREQETDTRRGAPGQGKDAGNVDKPAGEKNGPGNEGGSGANKETATGRSLAAALAALAATAGAGTQMLAAAAGLEQLGAGLQAGYPAAMLAAGGTGTAAGGAGGGSSAGAAGSTGAIAGGNAAGGSSNGTGTPGGGSPGSTGAAGGPAGADGSSSQPGQGYAAGGGQGSVAGPGAGSNPGAGNNPASGSNKGHGGQRAGAGAGGAGAGSGVGGAGNNMGNGSGSGGQGRGGGAGTGGGGLESIYAPYLIGGEGPASQVHGFSRAGETGPEVNLPGAPVVRGAVRPYGEIYPAYAAQARESLSRSPLPPTLENLVWQYFSSIDPGKGQN
ncbi:MAG: hypothetical protein PWQ18_28, partial [Clostridia bacterium]|nr:hypothetical protein [Clostridia bacterium]